MKVNTFSQQHRHVLGNSIIRHKHNMIQCKNNAVGNNKQVSFAGLIDAHSAKLLGGILLAIGVAASVGHDEGKRTMDTKHCAEIDKQLSGKNVTFDPVTKTVVANEIKFNLKKCTPETSNIMKQAQNIMKQAEKVSGKTFKFIKKGLR